MKKSNYKVDKKLLAFCIINLILIIIVGILTHLSELARVEQGINNAKRASQRDNKITELQERVQKLEESQK